MVEDQFRINARMNGNDGSMEKEERDIHQG